MRTRARRAAVAAGWDDYLDDWDEREMAFLCAWGEPGCPPVPETLAVWGLCR